MSRRSRERSRSEWAAGGTAGAAAAGQRQRRVGEELRHLIARLLRDGNCRDPVLRDASITVSEVRVSPDLRNATVYVMPLGGAGASEILPALRRAAPFLRGLAAHDLALRYAPQLVFTLDQSFDQADRIAELLALPAVERDLRPPPPAADTAADTSADTAEDDAG